MGNSGKKNCGPQPTFIVDGEELTICQMRIISLALHGLMRKEMASILGVKTSTIDGHFNRIYLILKAKLKLAEKRSNTALILWAINNGFKENGLYLDVFLFKGVDGNPFEESDQ